MAGPRKTGGVAAARALAPAAGIGALAMARPDSGFPVGAFERRQLTVMFVDVVDSTELSERIDPETFFAILQKYYATCKRSAEHYGGHVAQSFGDGLLIYFGVPQAHEDDAERAVHAGLAILNALKGETFETRELGPVRLGVRIAVNTGRVVLGPLDSIGDGVGTGVFGTSAVVAARLQNIAPSNAIVIGQTTYELVHGAFECESLGRRRVKGIAGAVDAWQVIRPVVSESRFARKHALPLTPLCGRAAELAELAALWRDTVAGHGRAVAISGEPGIGKSRLVLEFRNSLKGTEHETVFLQCSPLSANTPLAPVVDQVRRDAHIGHADGPAAALGKLKGLLGRAVDDPRPLLPYYGPVLSIPACEGYEPADLSLPGESEKALQIIAAMPARMAPHRPVLVVLEDAQWLDPTSRRVASLLLSRIAGARVMCIITQRAATTDITGEGEITHIKLTPLGQDACVQMIATIAGGARLPQFLLERILQRTDGIPLVVEELTRAVLNSNALERVGDRLKVRKSLPEPLVPASIQDSLMERLDRLGSAKQVAQMAAVLGRQFSFSALQGISGLSVNELERALDGLAAAGLIRGRGAFGDRHYMFNHAMIQEQAYGSLMQETRQQLHERAANWIAVETAGNDVEHVALLAYHFSRAARYEKAAVYWLKAGEAALRRSAPMEAIAHLNEGLQALAHWPDQARARGVEIELLLHLAMSYIGLEGWSGRHTDAAYRRALELARRHGSLRQKSMALWGVSRSLMVTDLEASLQLAREYLALAQATGDDEIALMAHTALTTSNFYLGHLAAARRSVDYILDHYRLRAHRNLVDRYQHDPKIVALVFGGHIHWLLGAPRKGRACCQQARGLAHRIGHPFMLALTYVVGAADHLYNHELAAGWASIEEGMRHAELHGLLAYRDFAPLWAVEAAMAHDPSEANLKSLVACIDRLLQYDVYLTVPFYQACVAVEMARRGSHAAALELADRAIAIMERSRETWFEPELHRVRGMLLARREPADRAAAEAAFRRSLSEARQRGALGWELRTALTYATHLREWGRPSEARALLKRAVDKYDPAESSAELREARRALARS
jgi:class 3 adenylate cyclase/predicted ATPase/urease gamma subunit